MYFLENQKYRIGADAHLESSPDTPGVHCMSAIEGKSPVDANQLQLLR